MQFDFSKAIKAANANTNTTNTVKRAAQNSGNFLSSRKAALSMTEMVNRYPNGITITRYHIGRGDNGDYAIVNFSESEDNVFFAPSTLLAILHEWNDTWGEQASNEALKEQGGQHVTIEKTQTSKGHTYYRVTI